MALDPITGAEALFNSLAGIVTKFIPDPAQKAEAESALRNSLQSWDASQNTVNAAEAASPSFFNSGWRPLIGWVCGAALCYQYLVVPLSMWLGFVIGHPIPKPPMLDDALWQLMTGMLGLGGLRTYEKVMGVAK